jgi:hypothetical protein
MTIERDPDTFDAAVTTITDLIGCDGAALAVGKSASLVEKWSRPGTNRSPNVHQALALDAVYMMAGGTCAPMHDMHDRLLRREVGEGIACRRELAASIAEASEEMGDAIAAAVVLTQPNATYQQKQRAWREAEQALGAIGRLGRTVKRFLSTGGQVPGGTQS